MEYYLPLTGQLASDRSRLEAMQRGAGLQAGSQTTHWHGWIVHPVIGQEALAVQDEDDKEFFTVEEIAALLSEQEAIDSDWFLTFGVENGI